MEDRLFSTKRIEKIKQEEISRLHESASSIDEENHFAFTKPMATRENLELSGLGYHESDAEEECLQTIRRMKEMMEGSESQSPPKLK
jgi:hypothetical protein